MNQLIKVTEKDGKQLVSARELYSFLGYDLSQWSRWCLTNIVKDDYFTEYVDYSKLDIVSNHQKATDYVITMDMAKELSMLERNDKGKQARKYFIEIEKQAIKTLSPLDLLAQSVKILQEQDLKLQLIENRVLEIENKPQINAPISHFSIMGYCNNINKQISLTEAAKYGRACTKMCNTLGLQMGKIADPRYGSVKTYPLDVLEQIIS